MEKKPVPVLVRMPPSLVKRLEQAAKKERRSRNTEACLRIEQSFSMKPAKAGA